MSFETSFDHLLKWEGGYGNNPHDAGGATNLGVIQDEYDRYRDRKGLPRQSVRYISKTEAEEIYKTEYWDATRCGELNPGVANCLFDADVNSGDSRGVQWLQEAINGLYKSQVVAVDKKCGRQTVAAANGASAPELIDAMLNLRLAFMHIARNSKTGEALWPEFGGGWQKRVNGVRAQSHALCGVSALTPPLISAPLHASPATQ
jgi:lysozyme family protein